VRRGSQTSFDKKSSTHRGKKLRKEPPGGDGSHGQRGKRNGLGKDKTKTSRGKVKGGEGIDSVRVVHEGEMVGLAPNSGYVANKSKGGAD